MPSWHAAGDSHAPRRILGVNDESFDHGREFATPVRKPPQTRANVHSVDTSLGPLSCHQNSNLDAVSETLPPF
jgi:hypothetical protein